MSRKKENISRSQDAVLTIGCQFRPVRGGIAQVLAAYESFIFDGRMKFVANSSSDGSLLYKLVIAGFSLLKMIVYIVVDRDIKIIHIHSASGNSFRRSAFFVQIAKIMGCKVILHMHGGGFKRYAYRKKAYVYKVLSKCDMIIALSESWRKYFVEDLCMPQVKVIPNIIEEPLEDKEKKNINDGIVRVLFWGAITSQKGIFDLLEAVYLCRQELSGVFKLTIGGIGEESKLFEKISQYGIEHLVDYVGWVYGREKQHLLTSSDIFVLPSYIEGFPISLLEAMSYSLPILSTRVGGIPEIVDESNGILIEPGDVQTLSHSLLFLVKNTFIRNKMGREGNNKVHDFYPNEVRMRIEEVYKNLLCS